MNLASLHSWQAIASCIRALCVWQIGCVRVRSALWDVAQPLIDCKMSQLQSADRLGQVASGSHLHAGPALEGGADSAPAPAMAAPTEMSGLPHPSVSEGVASAGVPLQVSGGKGAGLCAAASGLPPPPPPLPGCCRRCSAPAARSPATRLNLPSPPRAPRRRPWAAACRAGGVCRRVCAPSSGRPRRPEPAGGGIPGRDVG